MRQVSLEFAKESFIEMNESFSKRFTAASKSLLVLTAPKNAEIEQKETTDIEKNDERSISTDENFTPEDFIKKNTSSQIENSNKIVNHILDNTSIFRDETMKQILDKHIADKLVKNSVDIREDEVDKLNLFAVDFTILGETNSCTILTEIKFKDLLNPSLNVVNNPVEPS